MARPKTGTKEGDAASERWRQTMINKYGIDGVHKKMQEIGSKGGMNGYGKGYKGGFASDAVGEDGMTGRERAKVAGALGGRKSSRKGIRNGEGRRALADIARAERILEKEDDDGGDF